MSLHPIIGPVEQRFIVVVDVLVTDKRTQKLRGLERSLCVCGHMVSVLVEISVDEIDGLVFGVVVCLALLRR